MSLRLIILLTFCVKFSLSYGQPDSTIELEYEKIKSEIEAIKKTDSKQVLSIYLKFLDKYSEKRYSNFTVVIATLELGKFYNSQGLYDQALSLFRDLEQNYPSMDEFVYQQVSRTYTKLGNYSKALEYDKKALDIFIIEKDSNALKSVFNDIGDDYLRLNNPNEAIKYLALARSSFNNNDSINLAINYHNMGLAFKQLNDYQQSLYNLQLALKYDKLIRDNSEGLIYDYHELGKVFETQGELQTALAFYDSALRLVDPTIDKGLVLEIYSSTYWICDKLAEYDKGFKTSKLYISLKDSVFSNQLLQNVGKLELQNFLLEENEKTNQNLKRKRLIQYSSVFFGIILLLSLVLYVKRFNISPKILGSTIFLLLLLFFEFILVIIEPLVVTYTGNTPVYILGSNFIVALLFIPIHRKLETWFEKKVVNKKTESTEPAITALD